MVVESYLCRILDDYLGRVVSELGEDAELLVNSSSGGLINHSQYRAVDSLLSGPAAGVVGASIISKSCGFPNSINLDMGGTSTDVSRCSGGYSYQPSHQVGLAEVCNLALKIETVAAGEDPFVGLKMDFYEWAKSSGVLPWSCLLWIGWSSMLNRYKSSSRAIGSYPFLDSNCSSKMRKID